MSQSVQLLIARVFLSQLFLFAGIGKLTNIAGAAGYIASVGLPASIALAWAATIFEILAGLAILVGFQTKLVSWLLVAFCLFTAVVFHNNFADFIEMVLFQKNLAIAGGFLLLAITGAGAHSIDTRRS